MKKENRSTDRSGELRKWKTGGMIAALAASVAVFAVMVLMERNLLADYEKKTVFVAAAKIPEGQLITEENYVQYFRKQQVDAGCVPQDALSSPDQAAGLVAAWDIGEGVVLTEGMFRELNLILAELEKPVIAGIRADDICQLAGGLLRAGDRVNIYAVGEETASLVWDHLLIQQVFDASGNRISNGDRSTAAQRVNLYLDEADVADFYTALAGGSLRVVKLLE